jgi:hypothetical protein
VDVLFENYDAFLNCVPMPMGFRHCLLVFIPKGEELSDHGIVARSPGMTRPISLSNTANKFFALAVNFPLAQVAQVTVHPWQRGFVAGRSITDNVIEIEGRPVVCHRGRRGSGRPLDRHHGRLSELGTPMVVRGFPAHAGPPLHHPLHLGTVPRSVRRDCDRGSTLGEHPNLERHQAGMPGIRHLVLFALAIDPCIRYIRFQLGPERGILTAYADDIAATVKALFEALGIFDRAFVMIGRCSWLELHPGKIVVIPLWESVESEVRTAIAAVAPRLATACVQDYGKLLGVYIGPGAEARQWCSIREELRTRSRFLASLGMAWSGVLPLYRSHVLPVASHVAQMCPIPKHMFRTEGSCMAIVLSPHTVRSRRRSSAMPGRTARHWCARPPHPR